MTGGDSKEVGSREAIYSFEIILACTSGGHLETCDRRGFERGESREAIYSLDITLACTSGGHLEICDRRGLERGGVEGSYLFVGNHTGMYVWRTSGDL